MREGWKRLDGWASGTFQNTSRINELLYKQGCPPSRLFQNLNLPKMTTEDTLIETLLEKLNPAEFVKVTPPSFR